MSGTVNFADWTFSWSIPMANWGGGLKISNASFRNTSVLFEGTQPFVLVPYHGGSPMFKDGIHPQGAQYLPILPTSANTTQGPSTPPAANDNQWHPILNPLGAVVIEREAATMLEPARATIWAKFQAGNYQYIHRWEFRADGSFEAGVGLGGHLFTTAPATSNHVHNFYFHFDFDIAGFSNNAVQEFSHPNNTASSDGWTTLNIEGKRSAVTSQATKWRVVNKTPKPNGMLRSYEITPASDMGPDHVASSGDLWVLQRDSSQDGFAVGQTDAVLDTVYLHGPGTVVDGADVVVWHCLRHHHQTRQQGEESITLPYEFMHLHIEPRDFLDATPTGIYATNPVSP